MCGGRWPMVIHKTENEMAIDASNQIYWILIRRQIDRSSLSLMHLVDYGHNALDVITKVLLIPYGTHLESSLYILSLCAAAKPKNERECIRNDENLFLFGFKFWRNKYVYTKSFTVLKKYLSKTSKNAPHVNNNWNKVMTKNLSIFQQISSFFFCRRVSNHLSSFIQILKPLFDVFYCRKPCRELRLVPVLWY